MVTRGRWWQRSVALSTAVTFLGTHVAMPPVAEASHLGSSTASAGSVPSPAASAIQSFQPDLFTGRATTAIPIVIPPGRRGMQPSLSLVYSSSSRNGWLGVGWSLDIGSIERTTKHGIPAYDASDMFSLTFQGVSSDLVPISDGTYRMKDEGLFFHIRFNAVTGWEVRDKSGTRYLFGQTAASQVEESGRIFRWNLDTIIDTNGNSLTIVYAKHQGQVYPECIDYTGHEPTALAPANQVQFVWESRPDGETSFRSGFAVTTAKRLKEIVASADSQLARKYVLSYTLSQRTGRSILASIQQFGTDGTTSLPATTFAYLDTDNTRYSVIANNPSASQAAWNVRKASLDTGHENFGCVHPYSGLPWRSPSVVQGSADLGCLSASVSSDGRLSLNGCQDTFAHAWVYVYASTARSVSLPFSHSDVDACVFREDATGVQQLSGDSPSVSLQPGWSILHLTAYHQHQGWNLALSSSLMSQVDLMSPSQFIAPHLTGDVDGDAISDLISVEPATGTWRVSCATSCTLRPSGSWLSGFGTTSSIPLVGDFDGDTHTDIAIVDGHTWRFARSTGSSFQADAWPSVGFGSGMPFVGDFNGDGRTDGASYSSGAWSVALATGSGFAQAGSFGLGWGDNNTDPLTGDFNGDGLTDIGLVNRSSGAIDVRLSTGTSWTASSNWVGNFGAGQSHTAADFNGDGLTDVAYYDRATGHLHYAPSTGTGFGSPAVLPLTLNLRSVDDQLQIADFNGDGMADPAVFNPFTGKSELAISSGDPPDLLRQLANGIGGTTTITYQAACHCRTNALPFVHYIVHQIATSDGMGQTYTTSYLFTGGLYDTSSKEFRGFAQVTVVDAGGNKSITEFHQDACKKGRPFASEFRDATDSLWTKTEQSWRCTEPFTGVQLATLDQTDHFSYDGDTSFKQTRSRMSYDQYGNLTQTLDEGEVGLTGDERGAVSEYLYNATAWILNKPRLVQTRDAAGAVVAQRRFFYDGATDPATLPTRGQLTKEEEWLDLPTAQWLATHLAYDAYGNVATVTDALGRTTTNTYDASGTYLVQIRNAFGHTRALVYDPRVGQVTRSIDQNGVTTTTEYDALGRVSKVIGPTDTAVLPTMRYEYDLAATPAKTSTCARIQSGQVPELCTFTFTDGLGRTIQTRSPAEDPTQQVVTGATELNARGLVVKQWVPYLSNRSSTYVPLSLEPGASDLAAVSYTYDPLGRLLTTTDPDGTASVVSYDDWATTTTDANGHRVRRTNDAHGRLVKVEELTEDNTYTTTYTYDAHGNLVQVTDTAGNITHISYDSLGRKLSMDDPDMGRWTYAYDDVDNLLSQTDARGLTTTFAYDALNRLTLKRYTIPADSGIANPGAVTYRYDEPTGLVGGFTQGKLTSITDGSGSSRFEYDRLGRLIKESKTLDGTTYLIQRTYDLLGRLTRLTYPDNDAAIYTYNAQGGIETMLLQSTSTPAPQSIVSNIDYNAAGQMTKIAYGNGVITDYSYNPQTLRLASLVTRNSSLVTLQDFSYTFDPVGNVTRIVDAVHTATQTFEYDPLDRLIRATSAYGDLRYAYDPIGNMIQKEAVTMIYGDGAVGPHAVTSVHSPQSTVHRLRYDANGNMLEKSVDRGPSTVDLTAQYLSYDAENRLVDVKTAVEETITVRFEPGWNFFSLPLIPDDAHISTLFPNFAADFEQIARAPRPAPPAPAFEHYVGDPAFDDFDALEYGVGYQVYCKNPAGVAMTFSGNVPTQQLAHPIAAGWHLLPSLGLESLPLTQAFAGVLYTQILQWTGSSLTTPSEAKPAKAYYLQVTSASTWRPLLPRDPATRFVYDGDGGRIKTIIPSGTTIFLGQNFEKSPNGVTTKYIFAGSQRIASIGTNGSVMFYHGDHLGSSNVITDGTGLAVEVAEHTPYGALSHREGSTNVPHKFTGQRLDSETGFYFYNTRYYDPTLGRFVQPDTIVPSFTDPQAFNRYSYVRNNPLKYTDPSGHSFWKIFKRVYLALVSFGMSETIPLTTEAITRLSKNAGINPKYTLALYAGVLGTVTGGIGWGVGAAISWGLTSFGTSLAMDTGEGRQLTRKVAKEFFIDVIGMSPQAAYTTAAITVSTAVAASIQLLGSAAIKMRETMWKQSTLDPRNATKASVGFKGDGHGLAGSRWDASKPDGGTSWLGGRQGGPGKFFGINYTKGSGLDLLLETFAGPHDYLNNLFARDYDTAGNIRQGLSAFEKGAAGVMNWVDVPLSVPFGVAGTIAPEGTAGIAGAGLTVDQSKHQE